MRNAFLKPKRKNRRNSCKGDKTKGKKDNKGIE